MSDALADLCLNGPARVRFDDLRKRENPVRLESLFPDWPSVFDSGARMLSPVDCSHVDFGRDVGMRHTSHVGEVLRGDRSSIYGWCGSDRSVAALTPLGQNHATQLPRRMPKGQSCPCCGSQPLPPEAGVQVHAPVYAPTELTTALVQSSNQPDEFTEEEQIELAVALANYLNTEGYDLGDDVPASRSALSPDITVDTEMLDLEWINAVEIQ